MPQVAENISCPTPGCDGSRADIYETDDKGRKMAKVGSQPCGKCGR